MDNEQRRLTDVLAAWRDQHGIEQEITFPDDPTQPQLTFVANNDGVPYSVFIELSEIEQAVAVYIYAHTMISPDRRRQMSILLNHINFRIDLIGRLAFAYQDDPAPIQWLAFVYVDGRTFTPAYLDTLLSRGIETFERFHPTIAAVANGATAAAALEAMVSAAD